jgi:hypothetical protein
VEETNAVYMASPCMVLMNAKESWMQIWQIQMPLEVFGSSNSVHYLNQLNTIAHYLN